MALFNPQLVPTGKYYPIDSRARAIALNIPRIIDVISTGGYYGFGDGGGADYKRVNVEPAHPGKFQSYDGAWWELCSVEINVKQFGAYGDMIQNDTTAFQNAMRYLMAKYPYDINYYPGGPGQPYDIGFTETDRRTGRINVPDGAYLVSDQLFSSVDVNRTPFVGFTFQGTHRYSSILMLETNGAPAWFYKSPVDSARYQALNFYDLGFRSDDYRYGNFADIWSGGGPKQFHWFNCDFQNLQRFYQTRGTGNADLMKVVCCTGMFYSDVIYLKNSQSVQHDFIGSDIGTYGNYVHVGDEGGGNVNICNGSIDFIYHEDFSPALGNFMFLMDANASISEGNNTFAYRNLRIEWESYMRTSDNPPFGFMNSYGNPQSANPMLLIDNVDIVNGLTYTIDADGHITGSEYRKIVAFKIFPRQYVNIKNSDLLKNWFYDVEGINWDSSPNAGGIILIENCFDGTDAQLPVSEAGKTLLHDRVTYGANAGRVITRGMRERTGGLINVRRLLDCDPRWRYAFASEPQAVVLSASFKPFANGWPMPDNADYDWFMDIPQEFLASSIRIIRPAGGPSGTAYQLRLGNADKSIIFASSVNADSGVEHSILIPDGLSLTGVGRIRIWATGVGTPFQSGGICEVVYK